MARALWPSCYNTLKLHFHDQRNVYRNKWIAFLYNLFVVWQALVTACDELLLDSLKSVSSLLSLASSLASASFLFHHRSMCISFLEDMILFCPSFAQIFQFKTVSIWIDHSELRSLEAVHRQPGFASASVPTSVRRAGQNSSGLEQDRLFVVYFHQRKVPLFYTIPNRSLFFLYRWLWPPREVGTFKRMLQSSRIQERKYDEDQNDCLPGASVFAAPSWNLIHSVFLSRYICKLFNLLCTFSANRKTIKIYEVYVK